MEASAPPRRRAADLSGVADGFIALLENRFPPDPSTGAWLLGTGDGYQVMRYRPEALTKPR